MRRAHKQTGFTIVEILIVIVVIVILAVIVTVSYRGITENAKSLSIPNSLNHAAGIVQREALRGPMPTTLPSDIKPGDGVVLSLAGSGGGVDDFCINAYRATPYEVGSYNSKDGSVKSSLCPGVLIGSPLGGALPNIPTNTNLIASDFASWTLTGGASYNSSTKEITFSGTTGTAFSPLVRMGGVSANSVLAYEAYSTLPSVSFTPSAGIYSGSAYFASNGTTSVMSSAGYYTNGNAQILPLNAWTTRTWATVTGPNVQYVQYNINLSSANYTSNNFKIRNPSITRA